LVVADRKLKASNARIGAALAEYYPKFSLSGLLGTATTSSGDVFSGGANQWQGVLGLRWRLFDFGRVNAEVAAARGRNAEALAAYRLSVLYATEDVENSFSALVNREEILLAWNMDGFIDALGQAFESHDATATPFELVQAALPAIVARFETRKSIVIDRLMRSTEALRLRKQAWYLRLEERLFEALRLRWPEAHRQSVLRLVVMSAIGTMRVSMERWREESGVRPLADYLREDLALLDDHFHKHKRVRRRRIKG
jgi:outer membrane efflux protein